MFPKYSISWFFSSYRYWTTLYKYCTFNNYMALVGFNQSHTRLLSMGYVLKCLLKAHVLKTGCSWQTSVKWPISCWGLRSINRSTLDWVITEWSCWEVGERKQSLRQEVGLQRPDRVALVLGPSITTSTHLLQELCPTTGHSTGAGKPRTTHGTQTNLSP